MRLILASSSPRRQELLKRITTDFEIVTLPVDERAQTSSLPPQRMVVEIARLKADAVVRAGHLGVILAADTLVLLDGRTLGKPADHDEAFRMLRSLSGRAHAVLTGLWLVNTSTQQTAADCVSTHVHFKHLTDDQIEQYLSQGEYADKAGAYAIQGHAAVFVERLDGDFHNVMGLPVGRTAQLLQQVGYPIEPRSPRH